VRLGLVHQLAPFTLRCFFIFFARTGTSSPRFSDYSSNVSITTSMDLVLAQVLTRGLESGSVQGHK
jgi:hypothetical protein